MLKTRVHVYISGKVQGVFFRAATRDEAKKKGVTGWVKNLRDGRVEAVFEGEKKKVDEMIQFCHEGPRQANVTDIKIERENYQGEFSTFRVRY
ncbi:MAG: acylphosphatase [Candidatus Lokiarchaeota archaeon]|nr:acylphosphatase [Candidatus Lokiarchaeota archaeon]